MIEIRAAKNKTILRTMEVDMEADMVSLQGRVISFIDFWLPIYDLDFGIRHDIPEGPG
jgi:hypothetical protein